MAYDEPQDVITGELATASVQNSQIIGSIKALRVGELALSDQAAGHDMYATSTTQWAAGLRHDKQTFQGLSIRTSPDAAKQLYQVFLEQADWIVLSDGTRVENVRNLIGDITVSGEGGLDTGVEGSSRLYSIHYARKSSNGDECLLLKRAKTNDIDQGNTTTNTGLDLRGSAARTTLAQKFVAGKTGPMPLLELKWAQIGAVSGQFWITIEADAAGSPSGVALATSDVLDGSLVNATSHVIAHEFHDPADLVNGATYWIVARGNYAISGSNYLEWRSNSTSAYASGYLAQGDGSAVYTSVGGGSAYDGYFATYVTQNDTDLVLPSGYDQHALIGWVYNNSSGDFVMMTAKDRHVSMAQKDLGSFTTTVMTLVNFEAAGVPSIPIMLRSMAYMSGGTDSSLTMAPDIANNSGASFRWIVNVPTASRYYGPHFFGPFRNQRGYALNNNSAGTVVWVATGFVW